MISTIFGLILFIVGLGLFRSILKDSLSRNKRRGVDPSYFKKAEIALPERAPLKAWSAPPQPKESFDFDFGPTPQDEIKPIGLAGPESLGSHFDPVKKTNPPRSIGFGEEDDEDDGPQQETLGF
ncbi:MAG: hypothetical protein KC978_11155 [Candidatus Omnitrophica bacterium]|nr:hypothetical protein [Candidatus Omnitrophota bacterium]